ncbi:MAG: DsbA family protein [Thermoanaerobaculales bacterium]|nr:DsbA family protein [Thermoanaerobaculales bacterium]
MKTRAMGVLASCALLAAAAVACAQQEAAAPAAESERVVASYGDTAITAAEMEGLVGPSLVKLRQDIYDASVAGLNEEIFRRLVAAKAAADGVGEDEYVGRYIESKMGEPDEAEIVKVMSMYRARLAEDDAQARAQVVQALQQQRAMQLRDELRQALFAEAGVKILLEPPRVAVEVAEGTPTRGPAGAPVVIVEYTDYQCPYCARVQSTLDELLARYQGKVRHVFKNLPLPNHPQAQLAGEAALCAGDQGKYWEFHDWLFANQRTMNRDGMIAHAAELGMDGERFTACVDGRSYGARVEADMKEARSFGITGTPGFMINGRVVTGAQPIEAFEAIIDEELRLKGVEVPPKKAPEQAAAAEAAQSN